MSSLAAAVDKIKGDVTDAGKRVAAVLPLWVIIVIVVVGTGLLALLVGLCCLCACRRRRGAKAGGKAGDAHGFSDHHHHHLPASMSLSDGGSRSSEEGPGGRAKLRKRPPSSSSSGNETDVAPVDDRGVDVEGVEEGRARGEPEFRNMAPARKTSLLALPPLMTGALRASFRSVSGARGTGGGGGLNIRNDDDDKGMENGSNWHGRRTSNAWIDDDALHGPEVSPTKRSTRRKSRMKSWGTAIRESWPLKTPSPTLPHLPQFGGLDGRQVGAAEHESVALFPYNNHEVASNDRLVPNLPPPPGAVNRQNAAQLSPPRQLPKPPRQALLAANANTASLRPVSNWHGAGSIGSNSPRNRGLSYYKYEDTEQPVNKPGSLRSKTERGVGVGTGVMGPRGRMPSSDSTMSQILKDTEKRLQDGMVTGVAMRNRSSSSPPKRPPGIGPDGMTIALVRSQSRTPSPTKASRAPPGGGSSHVRQASQTSIISEPDSLLDDPSPSLPYHGLTSPSRTKSSQQMSPHRRRPSLVQSFTSSVSSLSTIHSETEDGPLTPNSTAPNSSIPFGMNQIADLGDPFMPSSNSTPAGRTRTAPNTANRGAQEAASRPPRREQSSHTKSDSPLSPVTGNIRSPDTTPTRRGARNATAQGANKAPTPQSQHNRSSGILLPAPTLGGKSSDSFPKRMPSNSSRPTGIKIPSLSLTSPGDKSAAVSPLVKRISDFAPPFRSREQTPEVAHPSPALSNARLSSVYDFYADIPESSNSNNYSHRRAGGEVRVISEASVASSLSQYSEASAVEREQQMAALSRISMLLNREIKLSRPKPTVRVVSQDYGAGGDDNRVSSTVAELRRMNSQVSTYSTAASRLSSSSSIVAVRPESVIPPRNGSAARNYHALASPVKSSPDRQVRRKGEEGMGLRMPLVEIGEATSLTPTKNRRRQRDEGVEKSGSGSDDGMSLYDKDGFYVTPARKRGLRS